LPRPRSLWNYRGIPQLRTDAWLLKGITGSVPGELKLVRGRLTLKTTDGTMFDVPLSQVGRVRFPWYYFGAGVKLSVDDRRWRISFVRPNQQGGGFDSARTAEGLGSEGLAAAGAARGFREIGEGRRAGKAWKVVLSESGRPDSNR
jgi:hypothetical protein